MATKSNGRLPNRVIIDASSVLHTIYIYIYIEREREREMVFKGKNGSKTEFHRNGLLATLDSNFQEGQN